MEDQLDRIMNEKEVAKTLGVSLMLLDKWAKRGIGPARLKIGGWKVGYRQSDVAEWIRTLPSVMADPEPDDYQRADIKVRSKPRQLQAA